MARVNNPGLIDPDLSSVNLSRSRYQIDLTGTADATSALSALAEAMRGGTEILTARRGSLRINGVVNLRMVPFDLRNVFITLGPAGQIHVGGNSNSGNNPEQALGYVRRASADPALPSVKILGAKGQTIRIGNCDYVQVYADTATGDTGPENSSAYCEFHFRRADTVELTTNPSSPNSQQQWITENDFYLKRTKKVVISGTYPHNHNRFHGGTFEGGASIEVLTGSSNRFLGVRFEGAGNSVSFGAGTYDNEVQITWASNPRSSYEDPYVVGPAITDLGQGNVVVKEVQVARKVTPLLQVNAASCRVFSQIAGGSSFAPAGNVTSLRGVDVQRGDASAFRTAAWRRCFSSADLIPVFAGDAILFGSDAAIWRPRVFIYDADGVQITNSTAGAAAMLLFRAGFAWSVDGYFSPSSNVAAMQAIVTSPSVRFIRVAVDSGNAAAEFSTFGLGLMSHRQGGARMGTALQGHQSPACTGLPTVGFESIGQVVVNLAGGFSRCTFALDTTALSAASGQPDIELSVATGIVNGDVIGVRTATATQWTTVNAVAGSVVTLAANLSGAVSSGARVTVNRWVAH